MNNSNLTLECTKGLIPSRLEIQVYYNIEDKSITLNYSKMLEDFKISYIRLQNFIADIDKKIQQQQNTVVL
jgi:hypothetical protein